MRFSMLYSGEQTLSFKRWLVFYAGDFLKLATLTNIIYKTLQFISIFCIFDLDLAAEFIYKYIIETFKLMF